MKGKPKLHILYKYQLNIYLNLGKSEYTFDDLRYVEFTKKVSVPLLPPTSHSIKNGHILRWFFIYKRLSTLLDYWDSDNYDPTMYGWRMEDGELYPKKELNLLPEVWLQNWMWTSKKQELFMLKKWIVYLFSIL